MTQMEHPRFVLLAPNSDFLRDLFVPPLLGTGPPLSQAAASGLLSLFWPAVTSSI